MLYRGKGGCDVQPNLQNVGDWDSIPFNSGAEDCLQVVRNSHVHIRFLAGIFERQSELMQGIRIQTF